MSRKWMVEWVIALVVVFAMATLTVAAEKKMVSQTVSGTIEGVDMPKTMVTLKTSEGKTMHLSVDKKQITDLKAGDHVNVVMLGKKVQAIHKVMEKQG